MFYYAYVHININVKRKYECGKVLEISTLHFCRLQMENRKRMAPVVEAEFYYVKLKVSGRRCSRFVPAVRSYGERMNSFHELLITHFPDIRSYVHTVLTFFIFMCAVAIDNSWMHYINFTAILWYDIFIENE